MYDPKPIDMSEALRQVYEGKKLDPVGQEDKDIDNDGDHDKSDKYLLNRRKVRGKAIKTRNEEIEAVEEMQVRTSSRAKFDSASGKNTAIQRGGETAAIEKKSQQQRVDANAAGARGPEFQGAAKFQQMKRTMPARLKEQLDQFVDSLDNEELDFVLAQIEEEKKGMHRDAETGEVVDKPEIGRIYYPNMPKRKTSVAIRKEKEQEEKKKKEQQEQFRIDRVVAELYKGKHGQSEKEYQDGRSDAGKMVSGDSKMSGAKYTHGRRVDDGGAGPQEAGGSKKPKAQGRMDKGARADLEYRKANLKKQKKESVIYELGQLSEEQLDEFLKGLFGGGNKPKPTSGGSGQMPSHVGLAGKLGARRQMMNKMMGKPDTKVLGFSKGGEKKKVKESLAFSEEEKYFINEECNFDNVSDEELVAFFEDAIIELAEDDQDLLEICEELEICGILMEQEEDDDKKKPSNMERLKAAASKAGERLKAGAKKVIGMGARAAGHAAGEFQAQRKKSKKAAMERGKGEGETKKSADDGDKTGGKLDDLLSSIRSDAKGKSDSGGGSSSNSGGSASSGGGSASSGGGGGKKPTFIQRVGSALKGALKKGVGKLSRMVSKGSDKLATRMGEEYEQIAHLYESGLFTIQEIENVIEARFDDGPEGTAKRKKALEKKRGMKLDGHPQFDTERGAMAYDGPNKASSDAKDRVIAKTKSKRGG